MLNIDTTQCNPSAPQSQAEAVDRDMLGHLTQIVGIQEITAKTWREFYGRVLLLERLRGAYTKRYTGGGSNGGVVVPMPFTPRRIQRWIGMCTNADAMTRTQFLKHVSRELDNVIKEEAK